MTIKTIEFAFWMVWNVNGSAPTYKHASHTSALNEAERLARLYPGQTFAVLQATDLRHVGPMDRVELKPHVPNPNEIPF